MNQLTDAIELPEITEEDRQYLHYNPNTSDLVEFVQEYAKKAIAAEHKRLIGHPVEPVAYLYHDASSIDEILHNERNGISVNSVLLGLKRRENGRNETGLYTANQLAAARLQDQQRIAELEAQIAARKPLTKDDIEDEWERITGHSIFGGSSSEGRHMYISPDEVTEFARAVEAANEIKEGGAA